jgi:hypothetical protein
MNFVVHDVMMPDLLQGVVPVTSTSVSVHVCRMPTICSSYSCPSSTLQPVHTFGVE